MSLHYLMQKLLAGYFVCGNFFLVALYIPTFRSKSRDIGYIIRINALCNWQCFVSFLVRKKSSDKRGHA